MNFREQRHNDSRFRKYAYMVVGLDYCSQNAGNYNQFLSFHLNHKKTGTHAKAVSGQSQVCLRFGWDTLSGVLVESSVPEPRLKYCAMMWALAVLVALSASLPLATLVALSLREIRRPEAVLGFRQGCLLKSPSVWK